MGGVRTIPIGKDTSIDVAEEYILRELTSIRKDDSVVLDMGMVRSVSAKNIPLLIIISYLAYKKTYKFVKLINVSSELKEYLQQIGFWNLDYISHLGHLDKLTDQRSGGEPVVLPITCVVNLAGMNDIFLEIRRKHFPEISSELIATLGKILNILGENCLDHSGVERNVGFYAFIEEKDDSVVLIVLDMGMGFYNSLYRKYQTLTSDAEAIRRVLLDHISCREGRGGIGYYRINTLIDEYSGNITVRSGNAIVRYGNRKIKKIEETNERIAGCCVLVELKKHG